MPRLGVFFAVISGLLLAFCTAQPGPAPDCTSLAGALEVDEFEVAEEAGPPNRPSPPPPPGILPNPAIAPGNLTAVCPQLNDRMQCCSSTYFREIEKRLREHTLPAGFERQTRPKLDALRSLVDGIVDYYQGRFIDEFVDNFYQLTRISSRKPPGIKEEIKVFFTNLQPVDRFNSSGIVNWFVNRVIGDVATVGNYSNLACLREQTARAINQTALGSIATSLGLLRNSTSALVAVDGLVRNITRTLQIRVPPSGECVRGLLRLTCAKCHVAIPKLCRNVCEAVARGCFAPYVAALTPQFNILWNVTYQLVQLLDVTVWNLLAQQAVLLNSSVLVESAKLNCNVTTLARSFLQGPANRKPLGVSPYLPRAASLLSSGFISNDATAFLLCDARPPLPMAKCWDGVKQVDKDIPEFKNDNIPGQAKNPVVPFNEATMVKQAKDIGTPISDIFKTEEVVLVLPAEITAPEGQVYEAVETPSATQSSQACPVRASVLTAVAAACIIVLSLKGYV